MDGRRGAVLLLTFMMGLLVAGLALAVGVFAHNSVVSGRNQWLDRQAFYIAEAGWQRARQALSTGEWIAAPSPGLTYTETFGSGAYRVTVVDESDGDKKHDDDKATYTITSEGYVPNQALALAKRKVIEQAVSVTQPASANLSLGAAISASSSKPGAGNAPENANDGKNSTKWQADTKGDDEWLALDYGAATTVNHVVAQEHQHVDGVTVYTSKDGVTWTPAPNLTVVEPPDKKGKTWNASFTTVSTRYLRVVLTNEKSKDTTGVSELESYNAALMLGQGTVATQW